MAEEVYPKGGPTPSHIPDPGVDPEKSLERELQESDGQVNRDVDAQQHYMGTPDPDPAERQAEPLAKPPVKPKSGLIESLLGRMQGSASASPPPAPTGSRQSGIGEASPVPTAGPVPPSLQHAAERILVPGPPPLRVERNGAELAEHLLKEGWTFSHWVEAQKLSGHSDREARTIARALELGTMEFGVRFLCSQAAEVQLRRLLALVLAAKMGTWEFAGMLEELPGGHPTSVIPRCLMRNLAEDFKWASKIDALTKKDR